MNESAQPVDRLATILDSISDGVFTVDESWRITSFNRAAERITGTPRADAVGRTCCDVFRASICETSCALRHTLETGEAVVGKPVYIVNAGGQRVPISISTAVLRDGEGRVLGGVETFRDLSQVEELRKRITAAYTFQDIVSKNRRLREMFALLPQVAASEATVLIEGESGTGKELIARALHDLSPRKRGRFVAVSCAALPETLLESELFGHRAGAFTGADRDRPGRVATARGGTLFLDEIGDVPPGMQVKLLRVLQERTYEPLGSTRPERADVRVLAATNRSLAQLVEEGAFRQDLYYRLDVVRLELPPLRERPEDVPLLVEHFIGRFNRLQGKEITGISPDALACLVGHPFPGNVRELENAIEHAFVLCSGGQIERHHLPSELKGRDDRPAPAAGRTLADLERWAIEDALRRHHGNRQAAARELGLARSTFFRRLSSLGVKPPRRDGRHRRDD